MQIPSSTPLFPRDYPDCVEMIIRHLSPFMNAKQREPATLLIAKTLFDTYYASSIERRSVPQQNGLFAMSHKQLRALLDVKKGKFVSPKWYSSPPPPIPGVDTSALSVTLTWRVTDDKEKNKNLVDIMLFLPPKAETLYGKEEWEKTKRFFESAGLAPHSSQRNPGGEMYWGRTDCCNTCGKEEGLRGCAGCNGMAMYCSKECQKAQWPLHKAPCLYVKEKIAKGEGVGGGVSSSRG